MRLTGMSFDHESIEFPVEHGAGGKRLDPVRLKEDPFRFLRIPEDIVVVDREYLEASVKGVDLPAIPLQTSMEPS